MVRITEFESARVSPLTPEISASTSSAISALLRYYTIALNQCPALFSNPQLFFKVPLLPLFQDKGPFFSNNVGSGSTGIGSGV